MRRRTRRGRSASRPNAASASRRRRASRSCATSSLVDVRLGSMAMPRGRSPSAVAAATERARSLPSASRPDTARGGVDDVTTWPDEATARGQWAGTTRRGRGRAARADRTPHPAYSSSTTTRVRSVDDPTGSPQRRGRRDGFNARIPVARRIRKRTKTIADERTRSGRPRDVEHRQASPGSTSARFASRSILPFRAHGDRLGTARSRSARFDGFVALDRDEEGARRAGEDIVGPRHRPRRRSANPSTSPAALGDRARPSGAEELHAVIEGLVIAAKRPGGAATGSQDLPPPLAAEGVRPMRTGAARLVVDLMRWLSRSATWGRPRAVGSRRRQEEPGVGTVRSNARRNRVLIKALMRWLSVSAT